MEQTSPNFNGWTAIPPEKVIIPRGSDQCFWQAVGRLGPFRHKMHDEAQRLGPWNEMGVALSMQLAGERVISLARDYNGQKHLNAHAPRTKDVVDQITKLESLAGELARYLGSLDDMTRFYLQTGGTGIAGFPAPFENTLMHDAEYSRLPYPTSSLEDEGSSWVSKLDALSRYANFCTKNFLERKGIEDIDHADKGGNTNLLKDMVGSAEWGLATGGWHLYDLFRPGKATGTEGGPFHSFLLNVFEFATGKDPEDAKLTPVIKKVVTVNRRCKKIVDRERALRAELDRLEDEEFRSRDPTRTAEIGAELTQLLRERLELWPSLFPHNFRRRSGSEPHSRA
jgi:hypothetical protein